MIDLNKIDDLIKGNVEPEDLGEEMFLRAYQAGAEGVLLFQHLLELGDINEKLSNHEKDMQILGYAMGQHDLETIELTLNDNNNKLH